MYQGRRSGFLSTVDDEVLPGHLLEPDNRHDGSRDVVGSGLPSARAGLEQAGGE